ncbi:hypothetical protein Ddye_005721 [Dipteronia dyeriana]|uniref:RNase H type-1 domain-containing protein n=1 Tax=Dipteronia dyeriana TaxID=168575 RepID=A0AAE0CQI3_9ROSI|nr:hypothetical protein Ddye_005721 [Dipteronia dyeriana]
MIMRLLLLLLIVMCLVFGNLPTPEEGMYKINSDAAILLVGLGAIIRDFNGQMMASAVQKMVAGFFLQVAEATAILRVIRFAVDSGLLPAVIESDNKAVVDLINSDCCSCTDIRVVISD